MNLRGWREHPVSALCIATASVVALWNAIASFAVDHGWLSAGDPALDELLVRDVWSRHFPLVGSYSRFGWNHPGGWFMYLASVPYKLSGDGAWAMKLTAALVAGAALAWCMRAGWHLGQRGAPGPHCGAAIAASSWLLFAWGVHGVTLRFAWSVDIAQMLFLAFLWWCALAFAGERGAATQVALLGTLLVHLYLGYLPLVGMIAVLLVVGVIIRRRRSPADAKPANVLSGSSQRWSLVFIVAMWIPLVIDQCFGRHNLSEVAEYMRTDTGAPLTPMSKSLQLLSRQLDGLGPLIGAINRPGWSVPWIVVLGSVLWVLIRGDVLGSLLRVAAAALCGAFVAILLARGDVPDYRLLWLPVIGVFWTGLCMWGIAAAIERHQARIARNPLFLPAIASLILVVGGDAAVRLGRTDTGQFAARPSDLSRVLARVETEVPDAHMTLGRSRSGGAHDLLASLRVAGEKTGQRWCDPLNEPWLAGEHRLCGKDRPEMGVYVIGPTDPRPRAPSAVEILHSPKGRVYLMTTTELVKIAVLTGGDHGID